MLFYQCKWNIMEACFCHRINKKGNCDFLSHNSDRIVDILSKLWDINLQILRTKVRIVRCKPRILRMSKLLKLNSLVWEKKTCEIQTELRNANLEVQEKSQLKSEFWRQIWIFFSELRETKSELWDKIYNYLFLNSISILAFHRIWRSCEADIHITFPSFSWKANERKVSEVITYFLLPNYLAEWHKSVILDYSCNKTS